MIGFEPNKDHDGYIYDPESGRMFIFRELEVSKERLDGKVIPRRYPFKGKARQATHIAFYIMTGRFPDGFVDHKDNNPWDNSWNNLREATVAENNRNHQPIGRWDTNGNWMEVGVYQRGRKYEVRINRATYHYLDDLTEANRLAISIRKELYGEFAYEVVE